jgi:hypothetical protein
LNVGWMLPPGALAVAGMPVPPVPPPFDSPVPPEDDFRPLTLADVPEPLAHAGAVAEANRAAAASIRMREAEAGTSDLDWSTTSPVSTSGDKMAVIAMGKLASWQRAG